MKTKIEDKLQSAFCPTHLEVVDESHLHAGHAGVQEKGGSHFVATIVSEKFEGLSRIARQRAVYAEFKEEMKNEDRSGIHALNLKTYTPQEWGCK